MLADEANGARLRALEARKAGAPVRQAPLACTSWNARHCASNRAAQKSRTSPEGDGHPLLGRSKTWRGLAAAILLAACVAVLIGLPWQLGALTAASAMAGNSLSSFVKRRFGLEPSSMTLGLDQVPESLLPAIACSAHLPLGPIDVLAIVLVFSVGELAMSRFFFAELPWVHFASKRHQRELGEQAR